MKFLISLLASGLLFSVFGCQPQKEIVKETTIVTEKKNDLGGVDDAGGGNGVNGRPLDEFIQRDFYKREAYQTVVTPVVNILSQQFPELAGDFYHLTHRRNWYFVPGQLESIPSQILGAYGKTDQMALQDTNKIWIDQLQYEKMNVRSQGILILHELVMGVRLMKYKHKLDLCIANNSKIVFSEQGSENYLSMIADCKKKHSFSSDNMKDDFFKLSTDDYELIRKIVSMLITPEPNIQEIKFTLEAYDIRKY